MPFFLVNMKNINKKWLFIALGLVFLVSFIRKAAHGLARKIGEMFGLIDKPDPEAKKERTEAEEFIQKLKPGALSFKQYEYERMANGWYKFMKELGNHGIHREADLQKYTKEDLLQLIKTFGIKHHPGHLWGAFDAYSGTLLDWFEHEYSGGLDYFNRQKLKSIFAKTGLWA